MLAVGVTAAVSQIGYRLGWPVWLRPARGRDGGAAARAGGRQGHDGSAARDGARGRGHGTRRLRAPRRDDLARRGRVSWPAPSTPWPPSSPRSTATDATSSPTRRTSCAPRWPGSRQRWRTSPTASCSPSPEILGAAHRARWTGWVDSSTTCSTCPAWMRASHRCVVTPCTWPPWSTASCATVAPDAHVAVSVPPGVVVVGDPDRLRQVVANLVTNAVVHGQGLGVVVSVERVGRRRGSAWRTTARASTRVTSSQVFERFYRGDGSRAAGRDGQRAGPGDRPVDRRAARWLDPRRAQPPTGFRVRVVLPAPTHRPRGDLDDHRTASRRHHRPLRPRPPRRPGAYGPPAAPPPRRLGCGRRTRTRGRPDGSSSGSLVVGAASALLACGVRFDRWVSRSRPAPVRGHRSWSPSRSWRPAGRSRRSARRRLPALARVRASPWLVTLDLLAAAVGVLGALTFAAGGSCWESARGLVRRGWRVVENGGWPGCPQVGRCASLPAARRRRQRP